MTRQRRNGMNYRWDITGFDVVPKHSRQFLRFADRHAFLSCVFCKVKLDVGRDGIPVWACLYMVLNM